MADYDAENGRYEGKLPYNPAIFAPALPGGTKTNTLFALSEEARYDRMRSASPREEPRGDRARSRSPNGRFDDRYATISPHPCALSQLTR